MKSLAGKTFTLMILGALALTPSFAGTVEKGSFSIAIPDGFSEFARQEQTVKSASGDIKQVTYVSKGTEGDAVIVTYGAMPGPIQDPAAAMAGGRDSLLKSLGATVGSQKDVQIDGHPGMTVEYSATSPRPIFARTDLVVAGARLYQVIYLGATPEAVVSPEVQAMFGSFTLNEEAIASADAPKPEAPQAARETAPAATTASTSTASDH